MSLTTAVFTGWHRFLAVFSADDRQRLLENLCDAYHAEAGAVAQFTQHAHRMYYPHFREGLLRIAAEAAAHIPWLEEKILALGGTLPQRSFTPKMGRNSWECLRLDLEEAQRGRVNLLEWIHTAEQVEPEIVVGLRRIRAEKQQHCEELRDMLMKSDPYTPPATTTQHEQLEPQKQAWFEQRKSEWLDQERAEWEAGGKQVPWAEWSGEREFRWATELPHRDLEWARRLAEQGAE
jgi:bacterioferritin (cytochrome b1)